jgi:hypothetical protein
LDDPRENQVNTDARVFELDDGHKSISYNSHISNGILGGHRDQQIGEVFEIVFASYVFGCDDESINIRAGTINTKSIAAVGEDSASRVTDENFVFGFFLLGDSTNKRIADNLNRSQNFFSITNILETDPRSFETSPLTFWQSLQGSQTSFDVLALPKEHPTDGALPQLEAEQRSGV